MRPLLHGGADGGRFVLRWNEEDEWAHLAWAPPIGVDLHLHATILDAGLDFWSSAAYVASRLAIQPRMSMNISAMSNSMVAGLDLAAAVLSAGNGSSALLTAGDTFPPPLFDRWQGDAGIMYGDAGSALRLTRKRSASGLLELVAAASLAEPELEGLHRGSQEWSCGGTYRPPVRVRHRKARWLADHGGPAEVDRRNATGVTSVVKQALYEAEIDLDDVQRVLCPHYGHHLLQRHCLAPLGIESDRTTAELGRRTGHMGASDQIIDLAHLLHHGELRPGEHVLLLGIGVGMTWTAAVLRRL